MNRVSNTLELALIIYKLIKHLLRFGQAIFDMSNHIISYTVNDLCVTRNCVFLSPVHMVYAQPGRLNG